MNPIYQFIIRAVRGGMQTQRTVYPVWRELEKEISKGQNEQYYREKISGKLTFVRSDYDWINSLAFDTEFQLRIRLSWDQGTNWQTYWEGVFYKTDCEFNVDDETCSVTPEPMDIYNDVLEGMGKEYNLVDLIPGAQRIKYDKRPMIQIYSPGESVIGCFLSGMWWEQECDSISNVTTLQNTFHFHPSYSRRTVKVLGDMTPKLPDAFTGSIPSQTTGSMSYVTGDFTFLFTFGQVPGTTDLAGTWSIKRNSDNVTLWQYRSYAGIPTAPYSVTLAPVAGTVATGNVTLNISDVSIMTRLLCDVDSVGGTPTYPIANDDPVIDNRNYRYVIGYPLANAIYFYAETQSEPTKWGQNENGDYYVQPNPQTTVGPTWPIARSSWGEYSIWFRYPLQDYQVESNSRKEMVLKDAYPLASVINVLLQQISPNVRFEGNALYSQFLYGSISGMANPDYKLFITPKSNILNSDYDEPASQAPITLKMITDMLRDVYKCYWFIQRVTSAELRFRIEHISYFTNGGTYSDSRSVGIDLTALQNPRNGKAWAFGQNKFTFDKPDMPERYQFGWMDEVTQPFEGYPIEVRNKFVKKGQIEEITINNFTSDLDYMLLEPSKCSPDGYALIAAKLTDGQYKVQYKTIDEQTLQNGQLSFAELQRFYLYDMPASDVYINGVRKSVTVRKSKMQDVNFPVHDDPYFYALIKTGLGNGQIEKITINLTSRNAKATLKYDTEQ